MNPAANESPAPRRSTISTSYDSVAIDLAAVPGHRRPGVLPHQRVLAKRDRHGLQRELRGRLGRDLLVVLAVDAEDLLGVLLGGDEDIGRAP